MQSDSSPTIEIMPAASHPSSKSTRLVTGLLVVLVLTALGLGYWTYKQSATLKSAQGSLAGLQKKYEGLISEKNKLASQLSTTSIDLANTNSELEKTKEALTIARAELSEANKERSALAEKMEKASGYLDVMRGAFEDDDTYFGTFFKVLSTGDSKFLGFWNQFEETGDDQDFLIWITYLFTTAVDILEN